MLVKKEYTKTDQKYFMWKYTDYLLFGFILIFRHKVFLEVS